MKKFKRVLTKFIWLIVIVILVFFVFFIGAYVAASGDFSVPQTVEFNRELPAFDANGYRFHGETAGDPQNPVVIVLHGGPGNDYRMLLPLKSLSDEYFIVFYDQRGAGLSPRVDEQELTMKKYSEDLDSIIDKFAGERGAILIGHSFGAMLASYYIGKHPEKINGAVLAEPGFLNSKMAEVFMKKTNGFKPKKLHFKELYAIGKIFFHSLHVKSKDGEEKMDWLLLRITTLPIDANPVKGYFCGGNLNTSRMSTWRFGSKVSMTMLKSLKDSNGKIHADFTEGVEKFDKDVLFIAGDCNKIIGEDVQKEHMKLFKKAALAVIPYAGHTMFGEEPERTLTHVREYLKRVTPLENY
ncbi:MAG: alpha/beta hydrolase [Deltaproteobacteria bacterium]|nr:alpha/beta hydrolase [Deltaproteobacteria bacterium]